jgi:hypothetical protein
MLPDVLMLFVDQWPKEICGGGGGIHILALFDLGE